MEHPLNSRCNKICKCFIEEFLKKDISEILKKGEMKNGFGMSLRILIGKCKWQVLQTTVACDECSEIPNAQLVCQLGCEDWALHL